MSIFQVLGISYIIPRRQLSMAEWRILPEAIAQLFLARIKVSFRSSAKWMPGSTETSSAKLSPEMQKEVIAFVKVINGLSARTPWNSTCLVKVLAAHKMLIKRKIPHTLHFGVKKKSSKEFEAHAWLSVDGEVIIGAGNLSGYKEISTIVS